MWPEDEPVEVEAPASPIHVAPPSRVSKLIRLKALAAVSSVGATPPIQEMVLPDQSIVRFPDPSYLNRPEMEQYTPGTSVGSVTATVSAVRVTS